MALAVATDLPAVAMVPDMVATAAAQTLTSRNTRLVTEAISQAIRAGLATCSSSGFVITALCTLPSVFGMKKVATAPIR